MTEPLFALGLLLAWLAGLRAYLTVFGIGLAGLLGWVELPPALQVCSSPWVLGVAGLLALVEFATDKLPGVDSVSDLLQTLLRVPAGAFLAAATLSPDGELGTGAMLAGGAAALLSHGLKSGTRAVINTSPEPASNWTASLGEDALVVSALALAIAYPWAALLLAVLLTVLGALLAVWLVRVLWRGSRRLLRAGQGALQRG